MAQPALLYEDVLRQRLALYGCGVPSQVPDYLANSAKSIHSLMIWDASQNAFFQAAMLGPAITNDRARYFIQFGVSRRLEMTWYAYRNLVSIAPPDRTEPLQAEESRQLMLDINTIYLNVRGILDNLAWALLHQFTPGKIQSLRPAHVGLFLPSIRSNPAFAVLRALIQQHDAWDRDVKARRDPAAHGIPLALPPALLDGQESKRYRELETEYGAAMERRDFELADQILDSQRKLGTFHPWFVHEPALGPMEIYPTVPDDVAHVVQIFGPVREYFLEAGQPNPERLAEG